MAPAAAGAGLGAAFLADVLDPDTLRRIFGVVALYFGVSMMWRAWRANPTAVAGEEAG